MQKGLLCRYILDGKINEAQQLAYDLSDVNTELFNDVNPISAKAALAKQGICQETLRLPLIPTTDENKQKLYQAMEAFEKKGY